MLIVVFPTCVRKLKARIGVKENILSRLRGNVFFFFFVFLKVFCA